MPVGIFSIMNELADAGFRISAINEGLELLINNESTLETLIKEYPSTVYCIDIHWHEHLYSGICAAKRIKKLYPDAVVVVGGITASAFYSEILKNSPYIDVVIIGQGEGVLETIVSQSMKSKNHFLRYGAIFSCGKYDIDAYNYIKHDWLIHASEYKKCAIL
jgi:radical SAM superfamily enzyme YgiQ (UPF0313 family)